MRETLEVATSQTDLGETLRALRKQAGLTQRDASARLGCSPQLVSQWETGDTRPPVGKLRQLAALYNLKFEELKRLHEASETGVDEPRDTYGNLSIVEVLRDLADEARRQQPAQLIAHSFSTVGFVSGKVAEVADAVCRCADAGVDIVYYCMQGDVGAASDMNPQKAIAELRASLATSLDDLLRQGRIADREPLVQRLWSVRPLPGPGGDAVVAEVFGSVVRILGIVRSGTALEPGVPVVGEDAAALQGAARSSDPWSRIIPDRFTLEDVWLQVQEKRGQTIDPRWIRLLFADQLDSRYYRALIKLRDSRRYELSRLLCSDE